ncbi:hypothetical protein GVAV_000733 [Gurleya vavrai]
MNLTLQLILIFYVMKTKLTNISLDYETLEDYCKNLVLEVLENNFVAETTDFNKQAAIVFQYQKNNTINHPKEFLIHTYVNLGILREKIIEKLRSDFKGFPNYTTEFKNEEIKNETNTIFVFKFIESIIFKKIKYNFCVFFYYTLIGKNEELNVMIQSYFEYIKKQPLY